MKKTPVAQAARQETEKPAVAKQPDVFDKPKPLYAVKLALDNTIAGFNREKLMLFCLLMTHKFKDPEDRAHIALVGASSAGKSHMIINTLRLFDVMTVKELADNKKDKQKLAVAYANRAGILLTGVSREVLKRWDYPFDNHIVCLTELDAALTASAYIRTLMSEGDAICLTTEKVGAGYNIAVPWTVQGKAVWVATTAADEVEHQFSNRVSLIYLNPGSADRQATLAKIAQHMGNGVDPAIEKSFSEIRAATKAFPLWDKVSIPYAGKIAEAWPTDVVAQNRIFSDFLRLVKAIALVHKRTTAIGDDYEIARLVFCAQKHKVSHSLLFTLERVRSKINLAKYKRKVEQEMEPVQGMTKDEITEVTGFSEETVKEQLVEFQRQGILKQYHQYNTDQYGTTRRLPSVFVLTEYGKAEFDLKPFKELMGVDFKPEMLVAPYNPVTGEDLVIKEAEVAILEAKREAPEEKKEVAEEKKIQWT